MWSSPLTESVKTTPETQTHETLFWPEVLVGLSVLWARSFQRPIAVCCRSTERTTTGPRSRWKRAGEMWLQDRSSEPDGFGNRKSGVGREEYGVFTLEAVEP